MRTDLSVKPISVQGTPFDGIIAAVGYEHRSTHVAKSADVGLGRFACGFTDRHELHYERNRAWFERSRFDVAEVDDAGFRDWVKYAVEALIARRASKIAVDVSSFSRVRIAILVSELVAQEHERRKLAATFLYSLGRSARPCDGSVVIAKAAPVLPEFAGWTAAPELPTAAVIGLGCERERAAGVVEFTEAALVWAFKPVADDHNYDTAVDVANRELLHELPPDCVIDYRVRDPFGCFVQLESLTYGLRRISRVMMVPFGPKIFTLCSLLVGIIYPEVGIWRVSSEKYERPADRVASGEIVGLVVNRQAVSTTRPEFAAVV